MSENQENVGTPKGRFSLKTPDQVGLDKLSLNSPRSPLLPLNSGNTDLKLHDTPKRLPKRRFLSARVVVCNTRSFSEDSGISSMPLSGHSLVTSKTSDTIPGPGIAEMCEGVKVSSSGGTLPIAGDSEMCAVSKAGESTTVKGGVSMSMCDLFSKPILHGGLSPVREERYVFGSLTPKNVITAESFKRPSPPMDESTVVAKRPRSSVSTTLRQGYLDSEEDLLSDVAKFSAVSEKAFHRAQSESALTVKNAVERINSDPHLVGDGSKRHVLPILKKGKHSDLKEINTASVVALIRGDYSDTVRSFEIVDCRYPYEFDAGHIEGAINLHTRRQVHDHFFGSKEKLESIEQKREHDIIIFHCEFSSQRGPDICRYVRDCDRKMNEYPSLHYPELYVLYGGYKMFYEEYKHYCQPQVYLPMAHDKHVDDCRFYKSLSKSDILNTKKPSKTHGKFVRQTSMKKFCLD